MGSPPRHSDHAIWWHAFGYFACYAPYSALTKAITSPALAQGRAVTGFELLPVTLLASVVGMFVYITLKGWWRFAGRARILGRSVPLPGRATFLSGLCSAGIIATTTLSYTFEGVSIVFAMLLMRGGVLVIAPLVDRIAGRHVRWFSYAGLALSMASLLVAFAERGGYTMTLLCALDIALYLGCYFVRLRLMSHMAKAPDLAANLRFFVEEQLVAAPVMLALLALLALIGRGPILGELRAGFTALLWSDLLPLGVLIGLLSQGTGVFGGLILLDRRENSYCVPVNRASSVLAGVVASYGLTRWRGQEPPSAHELAGAGLIIAAILLLSLPPLFERRRERRAPR